MKTYGYARVSTMKQSIARQIDNIKKKYPEAVIISEAFTGTRMDRPAWTKLKKQLKSGDTVVFDEISRMSRDAAEGFEEYKSLYEQGINLVFLKESMLNTDNFRQTAQLAMTGSDIDVVLKGINEYLMILAEKQIRAAFETAQHEVDFLHQRTSEGVQKAKERYERETIMGIPHEKQNVGRPKGAVIETKKEKDMKAKILKMSNCFEGTMNDKEVMETLKISRNTYYKYKKLLKAEQ